MSPLPQPIATDSEDVKKARTKCEEHTFLYRGHILNALSNRVYDFYKEIKTPLEMWNALERKKYNMQEEGSNKFLIAGYFDFEMAEGKPILSQFMS